MKDNWLSIIKTFAILLPILFLSAYLYYFDIYGKIFFTEPKINTYLLNMKELMKICWIFDDKAKYQVLISLGSIIKNNPDLDFIFYFIIPPNQTIDIHDYNLLLRGQSTIYVKHFQWKHTYLSERSNLTCQWSNIIVVKIFLREILSEVDKVLYLDTDIVNVSPVYDLWKFPIKTKTFAAPRRLFLSFTYINSGVVLYNLKNLRSKPPDFWDCANKKRCPIDDIWHTYCHRSERAELPYRYNVEFHPIVHQKSRSRTLIDEESKACFYHLKDFYHNIYKHNISFFKNISLFANNSYVLDEISRIISIIKWVDDKVKLQNSLKN